MIFMIDCIGGYIIQNEVPFRIRFTRWDGDFGMSVAKGFRRLKENGKR